MRLRLLPSPSRRELREQIVGLGEIATGALARARAAGELRDAALGREAIATAQVAALTAQVDALRAQVHRLLPTPPTGQVRCSACTQVMAPGMAHYCRPRGRTTAPLGGYQ